MAYFGTVHKKLKLGTNLSPRVAKLGKNLSPYVAKLGPVLIRWRNKELSFMGPLSKANGFHDMS